MAFLNNSGDIILDAVLTDEGRRRLSLSNGTFRIEKYALGDDEIDYSEWDSANSSGSAYYDLNILQTPILEAFTNNASSLKSKLVTYSSTNLLYLPVLKLNTKPSNQGYNTGTLGNFIGLINPTAIGSGKENSIYGYSAQGNDKQFAVGNFNATAAPGTGRNYIAVAQGLDTTDIPFSTALSSEQTEDKYLIEVDDRLVKLCDIEGNAASPAFIDDDSIATYAITTQNLGFFTKQDGPTNAKNLSPNVSPSVIAGPYQILQLSFSLIATENLRYSNYYFTTFGNTADTAATAGVTAGGDYGSVYSIDLNVSITGQTTGYRIDIPVRIVKIITMD